MRWWLVLLVLVSTQGAFAQHRFADSQVKSPFLRPDTTLNKTKVAIVGAGTVSIFSGAMVVLGQYWYKNYPKSSFQFFNDSKEWMGQDKAGHVFGTYFVSRWTTGMYRWTGMKDRTAIILGGVSGTVMISSIEMLDAFSAKWGFSGYDLMANTTGAALFVAQELAWKEQRITLKISAHRPSYPADLKDRAAQLYGSNPLEVALKDYNALITWASVNVSSFMKKDRAFPRWLSVSVGYGANGMFGGFANRWCKDDAGVEYEDCSYAQQVDRTDVRRYPQFYLSVDVDFTRIPTRRPWLKAIFNVINVIKVPAPTLEFNPVDKIKFHPLFF